MRRIAPGWIAPRELHIELIYAVGQISSMNAVISAFFSTNYLACAMSDPSMLRHAFDFIEKDWKILNQFKPILSILITVCLEFSIWHFWRNLSAWRRKPESEKPQIR